MFRHSIAARRSSVLILLMCGSAILWSCAVKAEGALAIGIPKGGAVDGFAGGNALGAPDANKARDRALDGCKNSIGASDAAKSACGVVATFKGLCYAIALDPRDGTPGVGWSIGEDKAAAEEDAKTQCRHAAGVADTDTTVCQVLLINSGCDK
jgi:hypothetical protein